VEWLGDVPAHLEVKRLKHGYRAQLGKMLQREPLTSSDFLEPYLRAANVTWGGVDIADVKAQPNIAISEIEQLVVVVPPGGEQTMIVGAIRSATARPDALAGKVGAAIERLREYRAALISAAVTGKVDVRGVRQR
jgi:type I restriction enzyme S subunit